jgi:hypothetical protein
MNTTRLNWVPQTLGNVQLSAKDGATKHTTPHGIAIRDTPVLLLSTFRQHTYRYIHLKYLNPAPRAATILHITHNHLDTLYSAPGVREITQYDRLSYGLHLCKLSSGMTLLLRHNTVVVAHHTHIRRVFACGEPLWHLTNNLHKHYGSRSVAPNKWLPYPTDN